jgi:hypothetical protein
MSTLKFNKWQTTEGQTIQTIAQVVQTVKTDTFTTNVALVSGGSPISGLGVSITPLYATSKILIFCTLNVAGSANVTQVYSWLARGNTKIGAGTPAGSRIGTGGRYYLADNNISGMINMHFLDSPATTDLITYNAYVAVENTSGIVAVNRTVNDTDNNTNGSRQSSVLTVMEVLQ